MRLLTAFLLLLLLVLQYQLWLGDGSLPKMWQLGRAVEEQREENVRLRERNRALEAEVADLKEGVSAIEERARAEMGMIKEGETFFQVVEEAPAESP